MASPTHLPGLSDYEDSDIDILDLSDTEQQDNTCDEPPSGLTEEVLPMPPPPEASYSSIYALKEAVSLWTEEHGYDVVIQQSRAGRKRVPCGRGGKTQNKRKLDRNERQRNTSSHKSGCPFQIWYVADDSNNLEGSWSIRHGRKPQASTHNHSSIRNNGGIANHRRRHRTQQIRDEIRLHVQAGLYTKQSLALLRTKFPDSLQTSKDLANIKAQLRSKIRKSMTTVDATLNRLRQNKFFVEYELEVALDTTEDLVAQNETQRLKRLFVAHPKSIKLFRRFHDVIILDNTYKTNRYSRPVLNICGVTGSNKTIQVGLCILSGEDETEFQWALQQLDKLLRAERIPTPKLFISDRDRACLNAIQFVFPEAKLRLCMWHMNKDVKAYARSKLGMIPDLDDPTLFVDTERGHKFYEMYEMAINSQTKKAFDDYCSSLQTIWPEGWVYLDKNWFSDFTSLSADFVLNDTLSFGLRSTSRVEGSHSQMKQWLQNSRSDIFGFIERLMPWWEHLSDLVEQSTVEEEQQALICIDMPFFRHVQRRIYRFALNEVTEQYRKASKEVTKVFRLKREGKDLKECLSLDACSGIFTKTHGLPCCHQIRDLRLKNQSLQTSHFHQHWWIVPNEEVYVERPQLEIEEPSVLQTRRKRGPSKKAKETGVWSTQRDELFAEQVDRNHNSSTPTLTQVSSKPKSRASSTQITIQPRPQNSKSAPSLPPQAFISNTQPSPQPQPTFQLPSFSSSYHQEVQAPPPYQTAPPTPQPQNQQLTGPPSFRPNAQLPPTPSYYPNHQLLPPSGYGNYPSAQPTFGPNTVQVQVQLQAHVPYPQQYPQYHSSFVPNQQTFNVSVPHGPQQPHDLSHNTFGSAIPNQQFSHSSFNGRSDSTNQQFHIAHPQALDNFYRPPRPARASAYAAATSFDSPARFWRT